MPLPSWLPAVAPTWIRTLHRTWNLHLHGTTHLQNRPDHTPPQYIFALWHGRQLPITPLAPYALRTRPITIMTSASNDGQIQADTLRRFGFHTVTGSSSAGGSRALLQLARSIRKGSNTLLAVDGPRGPAYCAKSGAVVLSRMTHTPILPIGVRVSHPWTLPNTWDGFLVPLPGSRVDITLGSPIPPPKTRQRSDLLLTLNTLQNTLATLNHTAPTHISSLHTTAS